MVSNIRRKSRAYLFGPTIRIGSRLRGMNPGGSDKVASGLASFDWLCNFNAHPLAFCFWKVTWQCGLPPPVSHIRTIPSVYEVLDSLQGAEKSCSIKRRKRGLRKGKSRSRGRHPRRTSSIPANVSKSPSSRKINHSGRKFIWAVKAKNNLAKDCERLNKFPRGQLPDGHPARAARLKVKRHCLAKWTRLHRQAEAAGIPPVAAFHSSFWKFLLVETSRGNQAADWDMLLTGLPRAKPKVDDKKDFGSLLSGLGLDLGGDTSKKTDVSAVPLSVINCPRCGSLVRRTRPVCQNKLCGKSVRDLFSSGD